MAIKQRVVVVAGTALVACSPFLVSFLDRWEGKGKPVLVVYSDKLAGGLPTVCRGLTRHVTTTPIVVGERWSDQKCDEEEGAALFRVQQSLALCFKLPPQQRIYDMASSHAWNFGAASTCSSGAMAAWNRGDWELGCQRMSRGDDGTIVWAFTSRVDPVTKKKVMTFWPGLANRRADETKTCLESLS